MNKNFLQLPPTDHHSSMMNITSRLAIRLRHLPDWQFNWSDTQPQRSRESLSIADFLPSEEDGAELQTRATHFLMRFLTEELEALAGLRKYSPKQEQFHPPTKTDVAPMKVLFKDEKYTSETIDILTKLMEDGNLKGTCQVSILAEHIHAVYTCTTNLNYNYAILISSLKNAHL